MQMNDFQKFDPIQNFCQSLMETHTGLNPVVVDPNNYTNSVSRP